MNRNRIQGFPLLQNVPNKHILVKEYKSYILFP